MALRAGTDLSAPATDPQAGQQLVRSLAAATLLQWLGASAILPMLPVYLRRQGGSDAVVGAVMSAFFVGALVSQFAGGRMSDRIGGRPVLVGGLVLYAAASLGFLGPLSPAGDIGLRAVQGLGSGAAEVAAFAMIAEAVPLHRRGRSFGAVYGGQLAGMAVGPLAGSIAGVGSMSYVFAGAGLAALVACAPLLAAAHGTPAGPAASRARDITGPRFVDPAAPDSRPAPGGDRDPGGDPVGVGVPAGAGTGPPGQPPGPARWAQPAIRGVMVAGIAVGLVTGVYESCWTLLLRLRGATSWQIGLSWTLFAAPFVAVSVPAGRLADRYDRRWLVAASISVSVAFCVTYPFLHQVALLVSLGAVEAAGFATTLPAAQSLLSQASPGGELGRTQGLFSAGQTAATALAAAAGGSLFAVAAWVPFVFGASTAAGLVACLPLLWHGVPGSVRAMVPPDTPAAPAAPVQT